MKTVAVIGGGITGLSAMYYLHKVIIEKQLDVKLILIEQSETLGGKIHTVREGKFTMETGADSIVARKKNVVPLLEELGLTGEMVYNATGTSYIHTENRLLQIPEDSVFGIPMSIESLFSSPLISSKGKLNALKDLISTNKDFSKDDSIGLFLEHFLGKELVENQISPVLSGIYSGKLNTLTIASTLPYLLDYKNQYGSIIRGLSHNRDKFKGSGNRKFISFKNGLSQIIDSIAEKIKGTEILTGTAASSIEKRNGKYTISFTNHDDIEADYVVLSVPETAAKRLLDNHDLEEEFNKLKSSSMISVYLGFDIPDSELPKDGTGFIVSEKSDLACNACTWTSRKWEHTSKSKQLLVRLFYKSSNPVYPGLKDLSNAELSEAALRDVEKSMGISAKPISSEVTKWENSMPNYHISHNKTVEALEEKMLQHYPGVFLAGCSYYGVGIPDCIANGEKMANAILSDLNSVM
ncbi:protoporphyrinogen oxidase [Peribacillus sp. B-H-3]|uniref:protoporphyrinogen oxidase n=1 Tax=Peribacillus sp. B-H-3 TaxID=3400420 RepID=UPI003B027941